MARCNLFLFAGLLLGLITVAASKPDQPFVHYNATFSYTYCSPTSIRLPTTIHQVKKIVREAHKSGLKIKAFGGKHSSTDIICPPPGSIAIDATGLDWIKINEKTHTVTVGAGVHLQTLMDFLEKNKYSLIQTTYYGGITIGGATGTGAHGSSLKHPSALSEMTVGMTFVTASGEELTVKDKELDDFRVHLGVLGVVVELELKIVPLFKVLATAYPTEDAILSSPAILQMAAATDSLVIQWFPRLRSVVILNYTYVPVETPGEDVGYAGSAKIGSAEQRVQMVGAFNYLQAIRYSSVFCDMETGNYASQFTNVTGYPSTFSNPSGEFVNPAVGYPGSILLGTCTPPFCTHVEPYPLLSKSLGFAFPASKLPQFVKVINEVYAKYPMCMMLTGILIRFAPPSRSLIAVEQNEPTVHFDLLYVLETNNQAIPSIKLTFIQAVSQALISNKGLKARPHWGKNGLEEFQHDNLHAAYAPIPGKRRRPVLENQSEKPYDLKHHGQPNHNIKCSHIEHPLDRFSCIARHYDPSGLFRNDFFERAFGDKELQSYPRCALNIDCFCSADEHCGIGQVCQSALCQYAS